MFSTGEFSRIARVSKRLLQFYDDEKLLTPAHVDRHTGYRRYSAVQLADLNRILALKELGLSLAEIRKMLCAGISAQEVRTMLVARRSELEGELNEAVRRLRSMEARLNAESDSPDVVVKTVPSERGIQRTARFDSSSDAWPWVRQTAELIQDAVPKRDLGNFFVRIPGDAFETRDFTAEAGCSLRYETGQTSLVGFLAFETARQTVATVAQPGGPDLLHVGCGAIGRYIESHGLHILDMPREIFLTFPLPKSCEETMIEIQFPVHS